MKTIKFTDQCEALDEKMEVLVREHLKYSEEVVDAGGDSIGGTVAAAVMLHKTIDIMMVTSMVGGASHEHAAERMQECIALMTQERVDQYKDVEFKDAIYKIQLSRQIQKAVDLVSQSLETQQ